MFGGTRALVARHNVWSSLLLQLPIVATDEGLVVKLHGNLLALSRVNWKLGPSLVRQQNKRWPLSCKCGFGATMVGGWASG